MKKINTLLLLLISVFCFAQNEESSTRKFIDKAQFTQISKDWSTIAEFNSGIGEYVKFYPIEVINLKTKEKENALQLDMYIKKPEVFKTAWVGLDEIDEFISFIETNVIPNLDLKFKKKSTEYIFKAKEMTFSYLVDEKEKKISISLNNYEKEGQLNYYFWTETQVSKIPDLLEVLKKIK
ncbi:MULTISPECIES: hypothetical protein [Flavobacterium]|uniref:Uncharacterized protein n=1 Tax=Flavobacterium gawalongense TaxID=2594432 RepID=A0A553BWG2_9FLAO|nr:hypothetical protein [Flavobacterium gawalongense]TRX02019.1 hypothetical protein FNW33_07570 [Flavobacterium gawalongense]TRX06547.1 hypothetical protein FNW12_08105 [Flavobacterium gawalongense]TRX12525.1 hypothetical protein FNW11_03030 [Flavobacterium gawalongense]TRX12654.1 hypothetical protein FNW10_03625 [Flavobacterium gawalongense]TRX30557.1 hypothetical protein FNW38_04120 [Flavobacterium gawalongense]